MMPSVTLAPDSLDLRFDDIRESRQLTSADSVLLNNWALRHRRLASDQDSSDRLLALGQEIYAWLNGADKFLERILDRGASRPLLMTFLTTLETEDARRFLDAPWELLAGPPGGHWALRQALQFCPVRRLHRAGQPPIPSAFRLNVIFMAAAPRGADNLAYEAEEAAILRATRLHQVDLVVEESGELEQLAVAVPLRHPDAVHLSCHGKLKPQPILELETDTGDPDPVPASRLVSRLGNHLPKLLFLSACETAQADPVLDSLARSLVRCGAPAVIGWAAPVLDNEAALFAALLYRRLTNGEALESALAAARFDLNDSPELRERAASGRRSRDWHLARLYLSPSGGETLAQSDGRRRHQPTAVRMFLDTKGEIPVASEQEFVGRRRQIQTILRALRDENRPHAGVLIHGMGNQGKSSLAARVAQRLEHSHTTVVVFKRYDAAGILAAIADAIPSREVTQIVDRYRDEPKLLRTAVSEILQIETGGNGKPAKPILLILDDFERAMDPVNRLDIRADLIEPVRALILAFQNTPTASRLLFTSRFLFRLPYNGSDLADRLLEVPLPGMTPAESRKQAEAKWLAQTADNRRTRPNWHELDELFDRVTQNSLGNPGLQNLLFVLALNDPAECGKCLDAMAPYLRTGALPESPKTRAFLENLAVSKLIDLLTARDRELLRAATLFQLPAPERVFDLLDGGRDRPRALGLLEVYEDLYDSRNTAFALNKLARPLAGRLSDEEECSLAARVAEPLLEKWGGESGSKRRAYVLSEELVRLALIGKVAPVLAVAGADALRALEERFSNPQAAAWAASIIDILDAAGFPPATDLLRTAAERCDQIGDVGRAMAFVERGLVLLEKDLKPDPAQHTATLLSYARMLIVKGQPREALKRLEQALPLAPTLSDKATIRGDIARILVSLGQVEQGLALHREAIRVYEDLGDKRSRAVTLGDIARILVSRGQVEQGLALHRERHDVYKELGDKRGRAITLGDIARILVSQGQVEQGLALHREELQVYEELGDKRGRAITLGDIARILVSQGQMEQGLALHREALQVYEELGDKRSRAVTLGDIARILVSQGQVEQGLALHRERHDVYKELGDKRGRAITLGDIAHILVSQGQVEQGLALHREALQVYEDLGDKRSRAVSLGDIARILVDQGQVEQGLALHREALQVYKELGDKRSRAITLGDIARILVSQGQVQQGLALHREELEVYEELGDKRSRAVTLGDIARILVDQGQVEQGLALHRERLLANRELSDQNEIAAALWDIGQIQLQQSSPEVLRSLSESYSILLNIGRLEGICVVGLTLGQILCAIGKADQGREILIRSRDGFRQLGRQELSEQAQQALNECGKD